MKPGPVTRAQLARLAQSWDQGQHVVISAPTGAGKTTLARPILDIRIQRGGCVVVFVCKPKTDETIVREYKGWTRWERMKRRPSPSENRILLWPKVEGKTIREIRSLHQEVFGEALDIINRVGSWTVYADEGLYLNSSNFLNLSSEWAMLHAMGRSSNITCITAAQRPSNLPLILYSSASHAFVGQSRVAADAKRLAELDGADPRELMSAVARQGRRDFLWIDVQSGNEPEPMNVRR